MNERIQKLAEQANEEIMKDKPSFLVTNAMWKEKFAELIVRECASIAGKAEYSDTWTEPVEDTIKKHFGVEE
jgi:sulfur relay (sulfurtransferase) DsrC/TusE family protein